MVEGARGSSHHSTRIRFEVCAGKGMHEHALVPALLHLGTRPGSFGNGCSFADRRVARPPGNRAKSGVGGRPVGTGRDPSGGPGGIPNACGAHAEFGGLRSRIRTVPHFVDRVLGHRALQRDGLHRQIHHHQGLAGIAHSGSAHPGSHHRLRLRRFPGGRGRIWNAGGGGRSHDGGPGLLALLRLRPVPAGQYRARGVRSHRRSESSRWRESPACRWKN